MNSNAMAENWIDTKTAAALTGYNIKYLRQLAHKGRIEARKPAGRDWLVSLSSLLAYKCQMDRLGTEKHNPWRDDLGDQEHGRPRE